mmetsp:Transcript_39910/g.79883  ORF Transcript_39910/g.79883 Transcript_39910/m.79883 type:complete len:312 (-) Transcript_39910:883-1818(-)
MFGRLGPAFFTLACAVLLYFLPAIARWTHRDWIAGPRCHDVLLVLMVAIMILSLPRIWEEGEDPFGITNDQGPDRGSHMIRIACFITVVSAAGVFFNPLVATTVSYLSCYAFVDRFNKLSDEVHRRASNATSASASSSNGGTACVPHEQLNLVADFWVFGIIIVVLLISNEITSIEHFDLECAMQRIAARRIDQLDGEKDRLDFERRMVQKRAELLSPAVGELAGPDGGASLSSPSEITLTLPSNLPNAIRCIPSAAASSVTSCEGELTSFLPQAEGTHDTRQGLPSRLASQVGAAGSSALLHSLPPVPAP